MKHCKTIILSILTICLMSTGMIAFGKAGQPVTIVHTKDSTLFNQQLSKYNGQMYTLIVKTDGNAVDFTTLSPSELVEGPDHHYGLLFEKEEEAKQAAIDLNRHPAVQYAEFDQTVKIEVPEKSATEDILCTAQASWTWGASKIGSDKYMQNILQNARDTNLIVAVVDTGVYRNTALTDRLLPGYNFVDNNNNTYDTDGHGTHVAGIIYDLTNELDVNILPVKVLSGEDEDQRGSVSTVVSGINYAVGKGAKVINLSLVVYPVAGVSQHSEYLEEAIRNAVSKGVTVVVASGNRGIDIKNVCPAHMKEAIVVGASDDNDRVLPNSDYGNSLDMIAPGENIYSTYLNYMSYQDGTSMAAAHVSALAAMVKIMYPSYTPAKIEQALKNTCRDVGPAGWDSRTGYGIPDLSKNQFVNVTAVKLSESTLTMTACTTKTLKATLTPTNATLNTIQWSSSNSSVVKVSKGTLTAIGEGTAKITASTSNGKKAVCSVTVKPAPIMPRDLFSLKSYSLADKKCVISVSSYKNSTGIQVCLENSAKKPIAYKRGIRTCTFTNVESNQIYYYRARAYYDIGGSRLYGSWSYRRVFNTVLAKTKTNSAKTGVYIITPKVTGVKSYEVCVSASNVKGSFTPVATVVPGKSYLLRKYQGKSLRSYGSKQKFYVVLKPKYMTTAWQDARFLRKTFTMK